MWNLMKHRYLFFAISLIIIIPGMITIAVWGLPLSIDFKGGSIMEVQFASGKAPEPSAVVQLFKKDDVPDAQVIASGVDSLIIRTTSLDETMHSKVLADLGTTFNDKVTETQYDSVGPSLATEATNRALLALLASSVVLTIFIAFSFRGVQHAFRYGVCTVAALIHDVLVMFSLAAIGGHFWGWEIDTLFLTALMTVIAFSAQDTIVVFDRIRENSQIFRRLDFERLVSHSVVQTLTRSINTQVMAVQFLLLALGLFGGVTLKEFAFLLLVGMLSGSYSSGFNAAPILVLWEKKDWQHWFKHEKGEQAPAAVKA